MNEIIINNPELESLALDVTQNVYSTNGNKLLPVKHNKLIQWYRELHTTPLTFENYVPKPELSKIEMDKINDEETCFNTGIVDDLVQLLERAKVDIDNTYYPKWTTNLKENKPIKHNITEYFSKRMYRYATRIVDHLDGLIQYDNYPKEAFGGYKMLIQEFKKAEDDNTRQDKLDKLIIIANSVIPTKIKYAKEKVIDTNTVNPNQVIEG